MAKTNKQPHCFYIRPDVSRVLNRACHETFSHVQQQMATLDAGLANCPFKYVKRQDVLVPEQFLLTVMPALLPKIHGLQPVSSITDLYEDMKDVDLVQWTLTRRSRGGEVANNADLYVNEQGRVRTLEEGREAAVSLLTLSVDRVALAQKTVQEVYEGAINLSNKENLEWTVLPPENDGFVVQVKFNRLYMAERRLAAFGQRRPLSDLAKN